MAYLSKLSPWFGLVGFGGRKNRKNEAQSVFASAGCKIVGGRWEGIYSLSLSYLSLFLPVSTHA